MMNRQLEKKKERKFSCSNPIYQTLHSTNFISPVKHVAHCNHKNKISDESKFMTVQPNLIFLLFICSEKKYTLNEREKTE